MPTTLKRLQIFLEAELVAELDLADQTHALGEKPVLKLMFGAMIAQRP